MNLHYTLISIKLRSKQLYKHKQQQQHQKKNFKTSYNKATTYKDLSLLKQIKQTEKFQNNLYIKVVRNSEILIENKFK